MSAMLMRLTARIGMTAGATAALFWTAVIAMIAIQSHREVTPERVYPFRVPHMFFSCMDYTIKPGESFGNFDIRQPMSITLGKGSLFHDSYVEAFAFCGDNENVILLPHQRSER
ncbi:hypothetical protein [Bradyrhizobium tunisiense]|uniref:hypothetical protein n=1 Tax=Bradyrhizobium tunisiense TaxID=3278709 RepID=UPI0035DDB9A9